MVLAAAALVVVVQEEVGDWLLVVSFWYLFASLCNFLRLRVLPQRLSVFLTSLAYSSNRILCVLAFLSLDLFMRFRIIFILMITSLSVSAQHDHYVYIQGDNQQIFYIRKGTEVISSSQSGFIILPKLQPGQQDFQVGFPKNEFPEYQFTFELRSKDRGFTLKNFNEKGWGLFDLQSMEVIMGRKVEAKKETTKVEIGPVTDDAFSVILASAVDDPRIRETSLVYREPAATPSNAVVKTETPPVITAPANTTSEKQKPPTSNPEQQTVKENKQISPPVSS